MTTRSNSFEGGVNGAEITPANSGGLSGDALEYVNGAVYSSARAAHGVLSARLPPAPTGNYVSHELAGTGVRWLRAYLWVTTWSWDIPVKLASDYNAYTAYLDANGVALYRWDADAAGGTGDYVFLCGFAVPPATSQWIRLEMQGTSAPSGEAEIRLFNSADSAIPSGSASAAVPQAEYPWAYSSGENYGSGPDVYVDDFGWSDTGWLGTSAPPIPPLRARLPAAVHRAAVI